MVALVRVPVPVAGRCSELPGVSLTAVSDHYRGSFGLDARDKIGQSLACRAAAIDRRRALAFYCLDEELCRSIRLVSR